MKTLLPLLLVAAASASAQSAAVKAPADQYSFSVDKYEIVRDADDFDGMSFGAKARVADNLRIAFSYADASSDAFALVSGVNLELDANRFSLGAEYDIPAGPGAVTLSLGYAQTSAEAEGGATGDAFNNRQFVLGARYGMSLGAGFTASLAVNHFISDFEAEAGFSTAPARAALAQRYDGSPTSVGLTLAYTPTDLVTIHLTYATEDSLLGLAGADNTISFGVRANF
jgi:predicted porin